jgi:hypothetical protein
MTRKKRNTSDDCDWDEEGPEEGPNVKAAGEGTEIDAMALKDSLESSDTPWVQPPKKGDKQKWMRKKAR